MIPSGSTGLFLSATPSAYLTLFPVVKRQAEKVVPLLRDRAGQDQEVFAGTTRRPTRRGPGPTPRS